MNRGGANALLWAAARKLDGGEDLVRLAVAAINDRDGTNAVMKGRPEYSSTRLLSDAQLVQLAQQFRSSARLPQKQSTRRRADPGSDVTFLPTPAELMYIGSLFGHLGFTPEKIKTFVQKQTRGRGLTTHALCCAVITPLERMFRARGGVIEERAGIKRLTLPPPGGSDGAPRT